MSSFTDKDTKDFMSWIQQFFAQRLSQPTPATTPTPLPQPPVEQQPTAETTTWELEVHKLVNQARKQAGLNELIYDTELSAIAESLAIHMDQKDVLSHTDPVTGKDMKQRFVAANYTGWRYIGENALYNGSFVNKPNATVQEVAQAIFNQWMNSPGHKANIMSPNYNREGLGIVKASNNVFWAGQCFARK